jgi:hypothetical protein
MKRKYAELSPEVKQQWPVEAVYILPVVVYAVGVISHTLQDVLQRLELSD